MELEQQSWEKPDNAPTFAGSGGAVWPFFRRPGARISGGLNDEMMWGKLRGGFFYCSRSLFFFMSEKKGKLFRSFAG